MRFRSQLFGFLFLLSLGWICYGFSATNSAYNQVISTPRNAQSGLTRSETNAAYQLGASMGAGVGLTFFLCSGLPFTALFGLLSWRNSVGAKNEARHNELAELQRQQNQYLYQQSQAQTAQAQMQYEQMKQKPTPPPAQLPANTDAIRAQLEAAKALLDAKNYSAARALLQVIDHPKAQEWITKLDQAGK